MQGVSTWLEQLPETLKWQPTAIELQNSKQATVKRLESKHKSQVLPLFSSSSPSKPQNSLDTVDQDRSQVQYYLSLIDDPLWKKVCRHVESMMGPISVVKIWECKLGSFSSEEHNIEINCRTEEAAQFLKKYAFVILGGLKQYFPALKELKISQVYPFQ